MTELQQFTQMLERAGMEFLSRECHETGGVDVIVDNEDDGRTEWSFSRDGKLLSILSFDE